MPEEQGMCDLLVAEKLLAESFSPSVARQEFKAILLKTYQSPRDDVKDAACYLLHTKFEGEFDLNQDVAKRFEPETTKFRIQQNLYNQAIKKIRQKQPTRQQKALCALWSTVRRLGAQPQFNMLLSIASSSMLSMPHPATPASTFAVCSITQTKKPASPGVKGMSSIGTSCFG